MRNQGGSSFGEEEQALQQLLQEKSEEQACLNAKARRRQEEAEKRAEECKVKLREQVEVLKGATRCPDHHLAWPGDNCSASRSMELPFHHSLES
ncbi:hypothetical protein CR513_36067, partial [Mucuna pruriens]